MGEDLVIKSAFEDGGFIPGEYTADGRDISPPLIIENIPAEAETLAVIVDDPDAPSGAFTHWLIWNIPAEINEISKNIERKEEVKGLKGALQGKNDFNELGYRGPAPPSGVHTYRFFVYALEDKLDLEAGADKETLLEAMEGHILQKGVLKGEYTR
ncbi:PBP family phospholipid-binding protein [Halanaerobium saccharolyticum]|uniref:PBP family phospholipid-binding protein n=1 Tax=Halanaerobium saccharolyticum TaxID=43595 RepID=A0A4R6M3L0_9FIRM|nr:YbhB/YbcL family Raf kinase inhibitor-like protein [Halanaerobium saccharolyticum]TDO95245.1 PBP family phospholipid-binding protein [Halanaerobium saccharolyticum]